MENFIYMKLLFIVLITITAAGNSQAGQTKNSAPSSVQSNAESETNTQVQSDIESTEQVQENTVQEAAEMKLKMQVGDVTFTATLADNSSVDALKELMADGPITLNMSDYANMEKGADLGVTLPQNNKQMHAQAGDIILYQGRTFVIYYDTNSWSLTPIGKMDNVSAQELRETLGTGDVTVILSLESDGA